MKMMNKIILLLALSTLACTLSSNLVPRGRQPGAQESSKNLVIGYPSPVKQDFDRLNQRATPTAAPKCARVIAIQALHVRQRGSENAPVTGWLLNGEVIQVLDDSARWTRIGGGYVNSNYLQEVPCKPTMK